MLTDAGRRRFLEAFGPLCLYRCADLVDDDGPGYEVDAPPRRVPPPAGPPTGPIPVRPAGGEVTTDVPLDVRCEPAQIDGPGAYFLGYPPGRTSSAPHQVSQAMFLDRGDSFTMSTDALMKAMG